MPLNSIGSSIYNILAALIVPKIPSELDYEKLNEVLESLLSPKKSSLVSQHYFLSTYQKTVQFLIMLQIYSIILLNVNFR